MLDTSKWDTSGREVWSAMNQMDSYYTSLLRQQELAAKLAEWKKDADNRALQRDIMNTQLGMAADETKSTVVPRALINANRSRIAQGDPETFAKIMSSNGGGGTYVPAGADSIQQVDATGTPIGKPIIVPRGAEAMTQALGYAGAIPTGQFAEQFFPSTKAYEARDLHLQMNEEKRRDELLKLQMAAQGLGGLRGMGGIRSGRRGAGAGAGGDGEDSGGRRIDIKTTDIERLQSFADQEATRQNGLVIQNGQLLTADGMPATEEQRTKFLNDSYKLFNMWANNYVQSGGSVLGATVGTRNMSLAGAQRGGTPLTEADLQFQPLAIVGNPRIQSAAAAVPAGAVLDASGRPYIPMQTMPEEYGQLGIPALARGVRGIWDAIGQPMLTK